MRENAKNILDTYLLIAMNVSTKEVMKKYVSVTLFSIKYEKGARTEKANKYSI